MAKINDGGDKRDRTAVVCLTEGVRKTKGHAKAWPKFTVVEISGIEALFFV